MTLSLKHLKHLVKRVKRKDAGISFSRSNRAWDMMLVGAFIGIALGAAGAGYEFLHVGSANTTLSIDPVETTRYHDKDIKAVLSRYDALAKAFALSASATTSTAMPSVKTMPEVPAEAPKTVASTTNITVE